MDRSTPQHNRDTPSPPTRATLSVVIITLNEEAKIRDCLESAKWADEIVIMDSRSSDRTVEIGREYTQKVYQNDFLGDGPMRNLAIQHACGDWILAIDADERVTPELRAEIESVLADPRACAYHIPRRSFFLGRWIRHSGWSPDYVLRLFRKDRCRYDEHLAHAKVIPDDKPGKLKNPFLHYPYANLSEYVHKVNSHTNLVAREPNRRTTLPKCFLHTFAKFFRTYLLRLGFLDGRQGLVLSMLAAYYVFLKHLKIWESHRNKR